MHLHQNFTAVFSIVQFLKLKQIQFILYFKQFPFILLLNGTAQ